jgi:N-acetylmuramoyl-L-alanine amidase
MHSGSSSRRLAAAMLLSVLALAPPAPAAAESACRRGEFRVVLDVGHTTDAFGAISARGVPEYEFNLSLADRIEHALSVAGFERTILAVTAGSARSSLHQRVGYANSLPADLFLSIHHDSVPEKFKQDWQYVGAKRRYSDRFKGHSIFVSHDNRDRAGSLMFGRLLGLQLKARGLHYTPHYTRPDMGSRRRTLVDAQAGVYRFDKLVVLRTTAMPAVLLEACSIINRDEEIQVLRPERQSRVSAAVTSAVEEFCAARAGLGNVARKGPQVLHAARPRVREAKPAPATDKSGSGN